VYRRQVLDQVQRDKEKEQQLQQRQQHQPNGTDRQTSSQGSEAFVINEGLLAGVRVLCACVLMLTPLYAYTCTYFPMHFL
jgi:hypothetical protein